MRQTVEPTVEEILESIKKVIARDNRVGADEQRRQRETHGVVPSPVHQAKDLDQVETEDDEALFAEEDVLDLGSESEFTMADERAYEDSDDQPESPLLTETARVSMQESLAALAMLAEPGAPPQIVRSGETSLEGMARELLRPALAEWLDKNLPQMVERMVAIEIARIVGKKG
jgi:cell pole-organizing protein PopZ